MACEESQAVTIELRKLGHEAYSCDIEPCSGGRPQWHFQQDVTELLKQKDIDGLLVGGASLDPGHFLTICELVSEQAMV